MHDEEVFLCTAVVKVLVLMYLVQVLELISHLCALSKGRSVGICTLMVLSLVQMVTCWMLWGLPLRCTISLLLLGLMASCFFPRSAQSATSE